MAAKGWVVARPRRRHDNTEQQNPYAFTCRKVVMTIAQQARGWWGMTPTMTNAWEDFDMLRNNDDEDDN
jgi:DNA primase